MAIGMRTSKRGPQRRVIPRLGRREGPKPASLSLCAVTDSGPGPALAFIEAWRPFADEIVLAVDERADPQTASVCSPHVERIAIVPAATHMERYLGWMHAQCTGDWIIRADDDEIPSAALAGALSGFLTESELTHLWLPRRWPYPSAATYLADGMWLRDIQIRLVRNIPALWRFSGRLHSNIEVLGASRIVEEPILHLANLVEDREARRRKVARYDELVPDLRHESERRINDVFLPEQHPDARLEALTKGDQRLIDEFLQKSKRAARNPARGPTATVIAGPQAADLERGCDDRAVSAGAYHARIRLLHPIEPMGPSALQHVQVEVTNLGDEWWPRGPEPQPQILLGHRWHRADGSEIDEPTPRTPFTETVEPGRTTRLAVAILAPNEPGEHTLTIDLVHEWVRWFDCAVTVPVCLRSTEPASVPQTV